MIARKITLPQSLSLRLSLYYAAAFMLLLALAFFLLYWSIGTVLDNRMAEDLQEDVEELSLILESSGTNRLVDSLNQEVSGGEHESVFAVLYKRDMSVAYASDLQPWKELNVDTALVRDQFNPTSIPKLNLLSLPSHEEDTRVIYGALSSDYVLVLGESVSERVDIMEIISAVFTFAFLIALPLTFLSVWLLTRRAIRGIKSVSNAALDIKAGNLDRRVNARNQVTEVQTLADTFDEMAERIQNLIKNMREMTDNIAHDLRSPLGRVRLLSESLLGSTSSEQDFRLVAQNTISECDRLVEMINVSLDVAETEAGVASRSHSVFDMVELTRDACELFETVADGKGVNLKLSLSNTCLVEGDMNSVQRMVANVLDNAVKYTAEGDSIRVALTQVNQTVKLLIRDSGIGIDECDFDTIFNRFHRVDFSRSSAGCGLGLSFARAVARAHGGDISVKSEKNKFTEFVIEIPGYVTENEIVPSLAVTA